MRVHHIQHVPFEGLGSMDAYFKEKDALQSTTHLYRGDALPDMASVDMLIVMGGPMGVADMRQHPWLLQEKRAIAEAIELNKVVLGVCLGAQLIADVLGARVVPNVCREIGWFPIRRHPGADRSVVGRTLPDELIAFHWHGDRFDTPSGAIPLASSEACADQGFVLDDRVVGLQFHLETTPESAAALIENCGSDIDGTSYCHDRYEIFSDDSRFAVINAAMRNLLDALVDGAV